MSWELDLTEGSGNNIDALDAGGKVSPGWYRATIDDYYEDQKNVGRHVFEIVVNGGPFDGKKQFFSFFDPAGADDEKSQKMARDRINALAVRLLPVEPGKVNAIDFANVGGTEIVIRVVEDKKTGYWQIGYLDIYPLDHHTIPADVRKTLNLPPARPKGQAAAPQPVGAGTATSANGPAKGQWDDL